MMLEADCTRCDETFVPHGVEPDDLIHGDRFDGQFCGGIGVVQGEWVPPGDTPQYYYPTTDGDSMILTPQEAHGLEDPLCSDPDCEFHHPEVREHA